MSGDVQPRKRKDKKKKKDDLGVEEPRGTAALLGEGDVFMHSQHEHGTGGHWCAKIIFFSLLAVLITLIGLIILENRGLTELEANSVESRYSGVLEGWLEDAPDDDHHDEHTLELKHPDDDGTEEHVESDLEDEEVHDLDEEHEDDDENTESNEAYGDDEEQQDDDEDDEIEENDESVENLEETDEEVDEKITYSRYNHVEQKHNIEDNDDDDDDDDDNDEQISHESQEIEEEDENLSNEINDNYDRNENYSDDEGDNDDQNENDSDDEGDNDDQNENESDDEGDNDDQNENESDDEDDNDDQNENYSVEEGNDDDDQNGNNSDEDDNDEQEDEVENYMNEENYQNEIEDLDDEENKEQEDDDPEDEEEIEKIEKEVSYDEEDSEEVPLKSHDEEDEEISKEVTQEGEDEDFLEADDDEPPVERITTPPAGKPFVEIEEETIEKPVDTLAEEEEYERKQEELRREEAQASHMWLKLAVGGALVAATHAVLRRATSPRDAPEPEEHTSEDLASVSERRMTLISEEPSTQVVQEKQQSAPRQVIDEEIFKKPAPVTKSAPPPISEQVFEREVNEKKTQGDEEISDDNSKEEEQKELYSDDEEIEEEEEEEDVVIPTKIATQQKSPVLKTEQKEESEPDEIPDDVEIIDDEQIEEEEEEEEQDEDEEEISDVDDAELLSRLEAKYGRLPEPERPGKYKGGGNSVEDEWPGEPSESYWREQLDIAEEELRQGAWEAASRRASAGALWASARGRWLEARARDAGAAARRDNGLLAGAIAAYIHLLKMNEHLSDKKLLEVARRTIDRIKFRGTYMSAEPIYRLLIRRFPHDVEHRNNLTVIFLMANKADLADEVLEETLRIWPNDRVALAHRGFVLKNHYNKLEEAVLYLQRALEGDAGPADAARFYYHLGDALLQLARPRDAARVHRRGAALGHFLSPAQRSLYNVPRLRGRPWWRVEDTPYAGLARALEAAWRDILAEAERAAAAYEREKEGLMARGEWSQLELFVRGREVGGACARAPVTCALVRSEPAAAACRRGQVKFSAMRAGTHVRAHVGPTNCRLRMHLALSNTAGTYIRVHDETRQWQVGKTLIFDDSFEHEVWHNGTGTRIVLIVDLWHPDLTADERRQLPAI